MKSSRSSKFFLIFVFLFAVTVSTSEISAQGPGGEVAIGARLGNPIAFNLKKYSRENKSAIELIAGWNFDNHVDGFCVNILFEKLAPLSGRRLAAMFGAGPSFAFGDPFRVGAAGIIGFDWRVTNVFNLQFDWQPTWYFTNGSDFVGSGAALSVRYVLNHKKISGKN